MKEIYFRTCDGFYETILTESEPNTYSTMSRAYTITDIIGTKYILPVNLTMFKIKEWVFDGDFERLDWKYRDIIREIKGIPT